MCLPCKMKTLSTKILWFITWRGDASLKKRKWWTNNRAKHRQQQGGKCFIPLPTEIMHPNPCTSSSSRKGIGIHKDFCKQPQIAAGGHILLSVSYHCSVVQCNICSRLCLLWNSLSLWRKYLKQTNIPTIFGELWTFVCRFLPQPRSISSHSIHSVPSSGAAGGVSLGSSSARRSRHSSWGQRPLDHYTTSNHTKSHCQTLPNKLNSILSYCRDKNNIIVQNTSHSVGALQLL